MSIFSDYQPLNFMTVNPDNTERLSVLVENTGGILWLSDRFRCQERDNIKYYDGSLAEQIEQIWSESKSIVFCLTIGAVVRLIAPLLQNKKNDPAIVVISPQFDRVISLVGGHQARGDKLAELIASELNARAIITSGNSALNLPPLDTFGEIYGWRQGKGDWTGVSADITRNLTTVVRQDAGLTWWQKRLPDSHQFKFNQDSQPEDNSTIYIGTKEKITFNNSRFVCWHPRVLWVGIGCERNTSFKLIESALIKVLNDYNLARESIASLVTIDLKRDEAGIIQLAREWNLDLQTYSAQELQDIGVPNPSKVVAKEVGTPSVAEASALKGASFTDWENNTANLIVSKQIIKDKNEKGAVTIAIAQSTLEYNPRRGRLYLIGTGPGNLKYLTNYARTALIEADVIIGYGLYIDLIKTLLRPEQIIESYSITEEKQRAERAIELSQWGLTVAVISSGDCGIYGMAGLVLEILARRGWDGKIPSVEVFSGITALQSLAAKIGSPLMHDFCAISLSDLLTPWNVIEKRIVAAASADFVTNVYNPRSRNRQEQIVKLQTIFLQYRDPNTPVAIARSIGREDEQITLTNLANMLDNSIDMLTTITIGNSNTKRYQNLLITPRGYLSNEE